MLTSGVLSSRELGGLARHLRSSQPKENSDSQRAPERITPSESARYTCSTWKLLHTAISSRTASPKSSARQARAVPLMAPAEVPQMMGNGLLCTGQPASSRIIERALSTPTW
jgi:hypothetical protein